ncbi:MAG: hypothetical protein WA021_03835 [Minisyncoccia bacterium]
MSISAHGTGASLERTVGDYWIDIGYDPAQLVGGDRIVFDFNLARASATTTRVNFGHVWVRLQSDGQTLLATGITHADIGPTSLLFMLPKDVEGELVLSARFQNDDLTLAETQFTISVAPYQEPYWWWPYAGIVAGGGMGIFIGVFLAQIYRRHTNRVQQS